MDEWHAVEASELPENLATLIKPELLPGERLIWASISDLSTYKPGSELLKIIATSLGAVGLSFGCFSAGVGVFGGMLTKSNSDVFIFVIVGSLLALLALAVLLGPGFCCLRDLQRGNRSFQTAYALTNQRAIFWQPTYSDNGIKISSLLRSLIRGVHRFESPDGTGSVIFDLTKTIPIDQPARFDGVHNVRRVEDYVRQSFLIDFDRLKD